MNIVVIGIGSLHHTYNTQIHVVFVDTPSLFIHTYNRNTNITIAVVGRSLDHIYIHMGWLRLVGSLKL